MIPNIKFISLKIVLALPNSVDPENVYVTIHLGLHCLTEYPFLDFWSAKG